MTTNERKLASYLLKLAASHFANHGCNDIPKHVWESWSQEEKTNFAKRYAKFNNSKYEDNDILNYDWAMMGFLAAILEDE